MKLALQLFVGLLLTAASQSHAQERIFLDKAELEAAFNGKTIIIERKSDGHKVRWNLKPDRTLYVRNLTITGVRPTTFSGIWIIRDDGAFCMKLHNTPGENCMRSSKEGDKTLLVGILDGRDFIFAEVLSVE
jgi:hypothetical protein